MSKQTSSRAHKLLAAIAITALGAAVFLAPPGSAQIADSY